MKKLYEGASLVSAFLLIVCCAVGFVLKVNEKEKESENRRRHEKKMERSDQKAKEKQEAIRREEKELREDEVRRTHEMYDKFQHFPYNYKKTP